MSGPDLEVEVKFPIDDVAAWRPRLIAAGIAPAKPRLFERNVCFDNAWDGLGRQGRLLRLRQDDGVRLTFKADPQPGTTPAGAAEVRVREELEVTVDDFDALHRILERIGFTPRQVYEKYRETFRGAGVEAVLDELPFGHFLELEGAAGDIRAVADRLGLDWQRRVLDNYLALMARLRAKHDLPFADLTFANFAGLDITIADVLDGP